MATSAPKPAATSAPVVTPPTPTGTTLVHWFPLNGSYADIVTPSVSLTPQGNTGGCASFKAVSPASSAFTQSCGPNQSPVTLLAPSPQETGSLSMCVYSYVTAWQGNNINTAIFSCNGFAAGTADCLELYYSGQYFVSVIRLHEGGSGNGYSGANLPVNQWFHMCVTYDNNAHLYSFWVNGVMYNSYNIQYTLSNIATPVLGGEGADYQGSPYIGSFLNFRIYSGALSQAQIQALVSSDYPVAAPTSGGGGGGGGGGTTTPSGNTMVFMLAGQSNMAGDNYDGSAPDTKTIYDLPQITQLGRYTTGGYSADGNDNYEIVVGMDPLEFDESAAFGNPGTTTETTGIGPGMSFAYSYVKATGQSVTLIPCAVLSSGFPSWSPGQSLYNDCLQRTQYVLNLGGYSFGGILWVQGEANSGGDVLPVAVRAVRAADGGRLPLSTHRQRRLHLRLSRRADAPGMGRLSGRRRRARRAGYPGGY